MNCELTHNNLENILSLWIYTERNSMPTRKYHLQTCTKRAGERGGVRERGRSKENIVRRRRHGKEKLLTFHCLEYDFIPANDKLIFNKRELRQSSQHNRFLCIYKVYRKSKRKNDGSFAYDFRVRRLYVYVCLGAFQNLFTFICILWNQISNIKCVCRIKCLLCVFYLIFSFSPCHSIGAKNFLWME